MNDSTLRIPARPTYVLSPWAVALLLAMAFGLNPTPLLAVWSVAVTFAITFVFAVIVLGLFVIGCARIKEYGDAREALGMSRYPRH